MSLIGHLIFLSPRGELGLVGEVFGLLCPKSGGRLLLGHPRPEPDPRHFTPCPCPAPQHVLPMDVINGCVLISELLSVLKGGGAHLIPHSGPATTGQETVLKGRLEGGGEVFIRIHISLKDSLVEVGGYACNVVIRVVMLSGDVDLWLGAV